MWQAIDAVVAALSPLSEGERITAVRAAMRALGGALPSLIGGEIIRDVHFKAIPPATLTVEADERGGLTITARVAPPASALAPDNLLRVTGSVGDGVLRIQDPAPPIGSLSPDHKLDVQPEPDHGFLFWMTHD